MLSNFEQFMGPSDTDLVGLEAEVQLQLANPANQQLSLLGYGEITVAMAFPKDTPRWACKRLPPSPSLASVEKYKSHVERYIAGLRTLGINVVPTSTHIIPSVKGLFSLYVTQPILPKTTLGPEVLRVRAPAPDDQVLISIIDAIITGTQPSIGLDAQLANWAWIDEQPWQIDLTTPFTKDATGQFELDANLTVLPYPRVLRPFLKRYVVPDVLNRYHKLRPTLLDFVGNLHKEQLNDWILPAIIVANRYVDMPITEQEAADYYAKDARLWETVYLLKKVSRFLSKFERGTYQFILPPPTER
jgi:hypothetical protein